MALSPGLQVTVLVTLDGEEIVGFPLLRRMTASAIEQTTATRAGDGAGVYTFAEILPTLLAVTRAVVLTTDQPTTLLVNDQPPDPATWLPLAADGMLVIFDTALDGGVRVAASNPIAVTLMATRDALVAADT